MAAEVVKSSLISEQQLQETPHFADLIFMTGLTLLLSAAIKLKTSSRGNN